MYKIIAIAYLALSVAVVSCKSTSNDNIVNNAANNFISATIADSTFSASGITVTGQYIDTGSVQALYLTGGSGSGTAASTTAMSIVINKYNTSTIKYGLGSGTAQSQLNYVTVGNMLSAKTGSIVLTSASTTHVAGTFTCTLTDGTVITNGKFDVLW